MDWRFKGGNKFRDRWKRNQGKEETFSWLGGKKIMERWKQFQGREEGVSGQGGSDFRAKI